MPRWVVLLVPDPNHRVELGRGFDEIIWPIVETTHTQASWETLTSFNSVYLYIISSTVDTFNVKVIHAGDSQNERYITVRDVLGGCLILTVLVSLLLATNSAIPQGLFSSTLVPLIHPTPCHTHTNVAVSNLMWCGGWVNGESGYWRRQHMNSCITVWISFDCSLL